MPDASPADLGRQIAELSKKLDTCCANMQEMYARINAMHRSIAGRYVSTAEVIAYGNNDYPAPVVASAKLLKEAVTNPAGFIPPTLP